MKLVQHHEKYLEIDGEDKIITPKEHINLHRQLHHKKRKKIPYMIFKNIQKKAYLRSPLHKTPHLINRGTSRFERKENIGNNIRLVEIIDYRWGYINITCGFATKQGTKPLYYIQKI